MAEWEQFGIAESAAGQDEAALETVKHIAHVTDAQRILDTGKLKAELVNEESRLKPHRIAVVWTSANSWSRGSFYGNIQFELDWADVVGSKRIYWIETITRSAMPAYRFLVTDVDHDRTEGLERYDPETAKGPIIKRNDSWFWKRDNISELLIEGDIEIQRCKAASAVNHHPNICVTYGTKCGDRSSYAPQAAARLLSYVINERSLGAIPLMTDNLTDRSGLSMSWEAGLAHLLTVLGGPKQDDYLGTAASDAERLAAVSGALALYSRGFNGEARTLARMLSSPEALRTAVTERLVEHFKQRADAFQPPRWE